jgi:hypothetical protein
MAKFDQKQFDFTPDADGGDLKQFVATETGASLRGDISIKGRVIRKDGVMNGSLAFSGSDIEYRGLEVPQLNGAIEIKDDVAQLQQLRVELPASASVVASGTYGLNAPNPYNGE